jgi:CheY-like chemotaxis protein
MALILVAEDDPDILLLLQIYLQKRGHQVVTATDGVELVEKAVNGRPHLVVSDILLPGCYGSTARKSVHENPRTKDMPFIFLTAIATEKVRQIVPDDPKIRVLAKPLDLPALEASISELLKPSAN